MLSKVVIKIIFVLAIILCMLLNFMPRTYASSIGDIFTQADEFIKAGENKVDDTIKADNMKSMSNLIYNTLLIIGIVIAVIVGIVIAIQFMTGSVAERAKIKETLIPYIAGCVVLFGAFTIWKIVVTMMQSI